jgi:hypothetical protein
MDFVRSSQARQEMPPDQTGSTGDQKTLTSLRSRVPGHSPARLYRIDNSVYTRGESRSIQTPGDARHAGG